MLKIHNIHEQPTTCSLVRTSGHVQNKWIRYNNWHVLKDDQGKALAYLMVEKSKGAFMVDEVGVEEYGLSPAVIRAAGDIAESQSLSRIYFHLPPNHPVARYLLQLRSVHETHLERNAGGMMAFISILETLESMIPEWEDLLGRSHLRDLRTELTLVVDAKLYRIRANRGAIDIGEGPGKSKLSLTTDDLIHLLTGYRHTDDIVSARRCLIAPDARALADTIFPKRHPYIWKFDRF